MPSATLSKKSSMTITAQQMSVAAVCAVTIVAIIGVLFVASALWGISYLLHHPLRGWEQLEGPTRGQVKEI